MSQQRVKPQHPKPQENAGGSEGPSQESPSRLSARGKKTSKPRAGKQRPYHQREGRRPVPQKEGALFNQINFGKQVAQTQTGKVERHASPGPGPRGAIAEGPGQRQN